MSRRSVAISRRWSSSWPASSAWGLSRDGAELVHAPRARVDGAGGARAPEPAQGGRAVRPSRPRAPRPKDPQPLGLDRDGGAVAARDDLLPRDGWAAGGGACPRALRALAAALPLPVVRLSAAPTRRAFDA